MGFMVTREDPDTGLDREYYKGDDGLLYNDYNHALSERVSDPEVDALVEGISSEVDKGILGTSESTEDYYNRQNIGDRDSTLETIVKGPGASVGRGTFSAVDGVLDNTITDPNILNAGRLTRDLISKAIPGDQQYVPNLRKYAQKGEGNVKKIAKIATADPLETATHFSVGKKFDDALEAGAEYTARQGARAALGYALKKGGMAYAKRMAGSAPLNAATGGLATPLLTASAIYDFADTTQSTFTGKPIHGHYRDYLGGEGTPEYYSGKMGGRFGLTSRR